MANAESGTGNMVGRGQRAIDGGMTEKILEITVRILPFTLSDKKKANSRF